MLYIGDTIHCIASQIKKKPVKSIVCLLSYIMKRINAIQGGRKKGQFRYEILKKSNVSFCSALHIKILKQLHGQEGQKKKKSSRHLLIDPNNMRAFPECSITSANILTTRQCCVKEKLLSRSEVLKFPYKVKIKNAHYILLNRRPLSKTANTLKAKNHLPPLPFIPSSKFKPVHF